MDTKAYISRVSNGGLELRKLSSSQEMFIFVVLLFQVMTEVSH